MLKQQRLLHRTSLSSRKRDFRVTPSQRHLLRLFFVVSLLCVLIQACGTKQAEVEEMTFTGPTMGTVYTVKILPASIPEDVRNKIPSRIQSVLDSVDKKMSTYKADSELSLFNKHTDGRPFPVSDETFEVFKLAQQVSEISNGAFDITVGPLVNAWGFGPDKRSLIAPKAEELEAIRAQVGYKKIKLDDENYMITKDQPDIYCDLSAIAKGYAVDRVAKLLDALGCLNYMVEVGGETRVRGHNKRGVPWQIAIEKPMTSSRTIHKVVSLENKAMATSGDYRNYIEVDGVRLSHTIDPRTGKPITHKLASVSVIHEECALADAFATALMVLGPDEGYELALDHNLAVYLIIRDDTDKFKEIATPAFPSVQ